MFTFDLYCKHEIESNSSMQEMIVCLSTFFKKLIFLTGFGQQFNFFHEYNISGIQLFYKTRLNLNICFLLM